jgi:sigma-B regulation protein RsbU (phosphoserine phosphatase)
MAFLKTLSIKWKLSFALIATALTLVSLYIVIAKRVFESDKISYVFDSQNFRLESTRSEIESKIQRIILSARSVIATYDVAAHKPSETGAKIFNEESQMRALQLWSELKDQSLLRVGKDDFLLPPPNLDEPEVGLGVIDIRSIGKENYLLTLRYDQGAQGVYQVRIAFQLAKLLPKANPSLSLAIVQDHSVVAISDLRGLDPAIFDEILKGSQDSTQLTRIISFNKKTYLESEVPLGIARLKLLAVTPEKEALGALDTLLNRSIVFLLFSTFGLIIVSLTLARNLTNDLRIVAEAAEKIGAGDFEVTLPITSKDEMGILAEAFKKMSREIKRLLTETKEKARMEAELKTASLVQERLLPTKATAEFGDLEISGCVLTSSECGGDWWYYFKRGDELFIAIADATGHGTPAALITAAARSIFSVFESKSFSLSEMMAAWDLAVSSSSQKEVFMTGMLFRINIATGEGSYINCAHEAPIILRPNSERTFELDFLNTDVSPRIGDNPTTGFVEKGFNLIPNEFLVLYTDGLFSVVRPDGKTINALRFGKKLALHGDMNINARQMTELTLEKFQEHRQNNPLPDDISIVCIRRKGPLSQTVYR